ncbi:hypothetical protein JCM11251_004462 [Rhodosporidiobolus azoricus]
MDRSKSQSAAPPSPLKLPSSNTPANDQPVSSKTQPGPAGGLAGPSRLTSAEAAGRRESEAGEGGSQASSSHSQKERPLAPDRSLSEKTVPEEEVDQLDEVAPAADTTQELDVKDNTSPTLGDLQQQSEMVLARKLSSYARSTNSMYSSYGYHARGYISFCRSVAIPPWPTTDATRALYLHGAVSPTQTTSSRSILASALKALSTCLVPMWTDVPGYREMAAWPGADEATWEWRRLTPQVGDGRMPPRPATIRTSPKPAGGDRDHNASDADYLSESLSPYDEDAENVDRRDAARRASDLFTKADQLPRTVPQLPCPGMPQVGDTFASQSALYKAVFKAVVVSYGCNVTMVSRQICIFVHSHGPEPKILEDPSWRPNVRNQDALAALDELSRAPRQTSAVAAKPSSSKRSATESQAPPSKRSKSDHAELPLSPGDVPSPHIQQHVSLSARPVSATPPVAALSRPPPSRASSAVAAPASIPPTSPSNRPASANTIALRVSPVLIIKPDPDAPPPPSSASSTSPSKALVPPLRRSLSSRRATVSDPAAFLSDMSAFLSSIDASLLPLAQPFLDAGITSARSLAYLALLEPDLRMALYEEIQDMEGVDVTDEQVALLEQALDSLGAEEA